MLKLLAAKNFALMADVTVEFDNGLTVVTGETGAGKSMIVEALSTLCGSRLDDVSIRSGKDIAEVTGIFDATPELRDRLKEAGIASDHELIVRRKIERGKRQTTYINDQIVSLNLLKELTWDMIDLIGQHENQSLFHPRKHLQLLDAYAQIDQPKKNYAANFQEYLNQQKRLQTLLDAVKRRTEQTDLLTFQINEIAKAQLKKGEEDDLREEKDLLASSEKRAMLSGEIMNHLSDADDAASERLAKTKHLMDDLCTLDKNLLSMQERLDAAITIIDEIYREISSYHNGIDFSQQRLEDVLERLEIIKSVKKKYGSTVDDVHAYLKRIQDELQGMENQDQEIHTTRENLEKLKERVEKQADDLSRLRQRARRVLEKKIVKTLTHLGMKRASFQIQITNAQLSETGKDGVEFYISTNPGEELKPLRRVASGGEISRITLALKTILSEVDQIPTVVFDEVDTGIGGRVAEAVGELLAHVSTSHQIICITHLPQISIFGNNHYLVQKEIKGGETFTRIVKLDDESRKMEIARMLGGKDITDATVEHAAEFLRKGQQK
jgi:DNA repair protein RecN (Recombination protein N)